MEVLGVLESCRVEGKGRVGGGDRRGLVFFLSFGLICRLF